MDLSYCQYIEQDNTNIFDMDFSFYVEYPDNDDTVYDDFGTVVERESIIAISHTL